MENKKRCVKITPFSMLLASSKCIMSENAMRVIAVLFRQVKRSDVQAINNKLVHLKYLFTSDAF